MDLVEIARVERVLRSRAAERFINRVFSPEEISTCRQAARPAECFAARFAAKEAVTKALGTGFSHGISPGMILVRGGERTRPRIELAGNALELSVSLRLTSVHVSLTHTMHGACRVRRRGKGRGMKAGSEGKELLEHTDSCNGYRLHPFSLIMSLNDPVRICNQACHLVAGALTRGSGKENTRSTHLRIGFFPSTDVAEAVLGGCIIPGLSARALRDASPLPCR